jgi:pimeloyl-ACP methyl ester carboxylesterase
MAVPGLMEEFLCQPRQMCSRFQPGSELKTFGPMARRCMCGSVVRDRRPPCSTAMVRPATCGRRSQRCLLGTTPLLHPTSAVGLSARPERGYDKRTQGQDIAGLLDVLGIERGDLVTHDIGNMVGYALAAQYPDRVSRFVIMDAPLPGIGPWEEVLKNPLLWHFRFGGPDMERLVAGRERIYLDRFWNEFSADPKSFSEAARAHYAALYALPGAMHAGFAQFAAFDQDAIDNKVFVAHGKLTMPVLAIGGEKSFGATMAVVMRAAATDVHELVIAGSGHWLMEEQPVSTVTAVRAFLDTQV